MDTMPRDFVTRCAKALPRKVAFYDGDRLSTWSELNQRANQFATALQSLGVNKGDVVAVLAHEHIEVYEHFHACLKLGTPRVGINWRFSEKEVKYVVDDANVRVILVQQNCIELVQGLLETFNASGVLIIGFGGEHGLPLDYETLMSEQLNSSPNFPVLVEEDVVAISYTSGTTGSPKGAVLSQKALREAMVHTVLNIGLTSEDVWFAPTSSAWITFVLVSMNCVNGMPSVLPNGDFEPHRFLEFVNKYKVTCTIMVPLIMRRLIEIIEDEGITLPSLRLITFGSSPATPQLIRKADEVFNCGLAQLYGVTEATGGWVTIMSPEDTKRGLAGEEHLLKSCGRPFLHFDIEIRDDNNSVFAANTGGEIWLKSDTLMTKYLGLEEQTKDALQEGWLQTNDMGYLDDEGFLYLTDRKNNLIITGSANVFPSMVENVLDEHPQIREVAVVGVPHPEWDEAVVAVIIPHDVDAFNPEEIIAFSKSKMAKFEVPKALVLVDDFPKGLTGKVLKKDIQAMFKDGRLQVPWELPAS